MSRKEKTIPLPDMWKDEFRRATFRTNFMLALSQPQIEFLCAVADGVQWNRTLFPSIHAPCNFIATSQALAKRGLIVRKSESELDAQLGVSTLSYEWCCHKLTPAGAALVQLLKVTGIFVDSDAALNKKSR